MARKPKNPQAQKAVQPSLEEFAGLNAGRDITRGDVESLPYLSPDDRILLGRARGDWSVYEEILGDDQVVSVFQQRRLAVIAHEWDVEPASEDAADVEAADFIRENLDAISWDEVTRKMLSAVFYGFAAAEVMWRIDDNGRVAIDAIKVRRQRRFRFGIDGRLLLLTKANTDGEPVPERKFWTISLGADDDDEHYGSGLASKLYWLAFFKRQGIRFWSAHLDKYGSPTSVTNAPAGASKEDKETLLALGKAVHSQMAVVLPDGIKMELLEAARGSGGDFGVFCDRMDASISKVVLGQTMTTDDGSSLSQSQTHLRVRDQIIKADADAICESFNNQVVKWLCDWNFPNAQPPKVWRKFEEVEDLNTRATRDEAISRIGYRPTLQQVIDTYGGQWEEMPVQASAPFSAAPSFAEATSTPEPQAPLADRLEREAAPVIDAMVDAARRVVMEADSIEEIPDRIMSLNLDADMADLANVIAQAMAAARLLGLAEVRDEAVAHARA